MTVFSVTRNSQRAWYGKTGGHLPGVRSGERLSGFKPARRPFKLDLRSHRLPGAGLSAFSKGGAITLHPTPGKIGAFGGIVSVGAGSAAASKLALKRLATKLVKPLQVADLLRPLATRFWTTQVTPAGFPGWGMFPDQWTSDAGAPYPGISVGDYTANGFDVGPYGPGTENLVDFSDGDIFGWRYWGHYPWNNNPVTAGGFPAVDWARQTLSLTSPKTGTKTRSNIKYRILENLMPRLEVTPWKPTNNIAITITTRREPTNIKQDVPRKKDGGNKAKPASQFVYAVLKGFANALGEMREWVDILAEASHYIKGSIMIPEEIRFGHEVQAKLYWLFVVGGINFLDWDELAVLVIENEGEDLIYGFAGKLSKFAAIHLDLTVGPQTGPAI